VWLCGMQSTSTVCWSGQSKAQGSPITRRVKTSLSIDLQDYSRVVRAWWPFDVPKLKIQDELRMLNLSIILIQSQLPQLNTSRATAFPNLILLLFPPWIMANLILWILGHSVIPIIALQAHPSPTHHTTF